MGVSDIPEFVFDPDEIAAIKASLGTTDVDESQDTPISEIRPKRRGRPPGSKNKAYSAPTEVDPDNVIVGKLPAAPLTKREEREVASRLVNILTGATGMAGMVKPYLPMTEDEAKAIAEPLASYLVRNEPTSGIAREILENYDLVALTLGVGAYSVRVYSDRKHEVAEQRSIDAKIADRISSIQASGNGREPDEGNRPNISIPDASRSGSTPFDL